MNGTRTDLVLSGLAKRFGVDADPRRQALVRAAVHGDIFAEHIVVAHLQPCRLADILEVLGFPADHGSRTSKCSSSATGMGLAKR